jgi:hypothetical protein
MEWGAMVWRLFAILTDVEVLSLQHTLLSMHTWQHEHACRLP